MEDDPVTVWMDALRHADDSAADSLWRHFVQRLYESARKRLNPDTRRVYDEEDAAQSAFHSVCSGIAAGRFPDLHDREGLWRLLLRVTFAAPVTLEIVGKVTGRLIAACAILLQ